MAGREENTGHAILGIKEVQYEKLGRRGTAEPVQHAAALLCGTFGTLRHYSAALCGTLQDSAALCGTVRHHSGAHEFGSGPTIFFLGPTILGRGPQFFFWGPRIWVVAHNFFLGAHEFGRSPICSGPLGGPSSRAILALAGYPACLGEAVYGHLGRSPGQFFRQDSLIHCPMVSHLPAIPLTTLCLLRP